MLLLTSSSDALHLVQSPVVQLDAQASFLDHDGTTPVPGRKNTPISAAEDDVVTGPAGQAKRSVKNVHIRNADLSLSTTVTLLHTDGGTAAELRKVTLGPGETLAYVESRGFFVLTSDGQER